MIWIWELDYKESWVPKNWCFWIVVLEKTLESPLDCKEIQPVHPKGNQFWVFIGRTDVEVEAPILWPPDAKRWLTWNTLMLGKIEGRRRRGQQRIRWLDGIHRHECEQALGVGNEQGSLACCSPWGRKESDTTEQLNWTELRWNQDLAPRLHYCFLTAPCLWSSIFPSLLSNCLNLHFRTQGRSQKLESIPLK